jgi:outer membrane protein W
VLIALLLAPALAAAEPPKQHRLYVRAGAAVVAPVESSREMELADIDGAASLAVQNGPIAGSGATIDSATIPAMIIGYRLPWLHGRLSLETILGTPFKVKFHATGTIATESLAPMALGIPTGVQPLGSELGEATAAPPTLTAVYDLAPGARVRPFVGAGVAVLLAFSPKVTNPILTEVREPEMTVAPAPGLVLQGGVEARITRRIYARLDVKFIAGMLARAEVHHIVVKTPELPLFETAEVGTAKMSMWVNPFILCAGIGADFW